MMLFRTKHSWPGQAMILISRTLMYYSYIGMLVIVIF